MLSEDPDFREKARNFMVEYLSKIMTASYLDLEVPHNKSRNVNEACLAKIISVRDQEIRNIRQKNKIPGGQGSGCQMQCLQSVLYNSLDG